MSGTWAVVPARGGSKGLPGKHLRYLRGRPLIAHTIEASRAAERVIVSTDDPGIAEVARACGAEVPFLRPARLATDTASVRDAVFHTIDRLVEEEGRAPSAVAVMFATSPLRPPGHLAGLLRRLDRAYCATTVARVPDIVVPALDTGLRPEGPPPASGGRVPLCGTAPSQGPAGRLDHLVKSLGLGTAMRYVPPGLRPFESRGRFLRWAAEKGVQTVWSFETVDAPECLIDIDTAEDLDRAERGQPPPVGSSHPATLYRTLRPCEPCEGALAWTRGYDDSGACVLQTPVLRLRGGRAERAWDYRVAEELAGNASFVERHVVRESDPSEATMWFPPTLDWTYDIGTDLRVRPGGPILGRQQHPAETQR
ncbi:MAG: acylneuraminate cytidylyltransferase family protein [Planctomycetes bacterium]|nr:acylneuraminate cytidylyltransferase family protein [Planctomycetota bacterium]